jgi:acetyl esterase/lipase
MRLERIPLRPDRGDVYLQAYWLENSPEFQAGMQRPVVIVCPGGGYRGTSDREAEPVAMRFVAQGYHACVLRYSVMTPLPAPQIDLAKAIVTVRQRAAEHAVDTDRVIVCGFSAGGHLAASLGVMWDKPYIYEAVGAAPVQVRPDALILGYAVIDLELVARPPLVVDPHTGQALPDTGILSAAFGEPQPAPALVDPYRLDHLVSAATPPAFIWHTADDAVVPAESALRFAAALARHHVPYELHIFQTGVHGLSLADATTDSGGRFTNPPVQAWMLLVLEWLKRL